ncbi:unnamed protein product [Lymnaea stagnalis]|uniref:Cytochrome P450 n=1 Tax=Lymnaea stagnalis TaxID=6523 RepID=A0AAV2IA13_LYMST
MDVPGHVGWPIIGDKSLKFYRDPHRFLDENINQERSPLFAIRFLNRPTIFVCSNKGVQDVLNDEDNSFDLGYESFIGPMFDNNILSASNEEAKSSREILSALLMGNCMSTFEISLNRILENKISRVLVGKPSCIYKFFKELFSEVCLTLFLGIDFMESPELAEKITTLTKEHWRGITAVPLNLQLSWTGTSTYSKAHQAKSKLLEVIKSQIEKAKDCFPGKLRDTPGLTGAEKNHHLLLFTTALIPKVLASICTSLFLEIGKSEKTHLQAQANEDLEFIEYLVLETKRLHPPLLGGRRIAQKSCLVAGYKIPENYAVVFMYPSAHRDESVFENPHEFLPNRWSANPELKSKLFTYGLGPRACIGERISWTILKNTLQALLSKFVWTLCQGQDVSQKYLPVSRPKQNVLMTASLKI